jgi:hypothetical protein
MDLNRLRRGERIAAIAALALFVDMFLNWYGINLANALPNGGADAARTLGIDLNVSESFNAWESFSILDLFLLVVIVVAIGLAVLTATQRSVALPVAASVITSGLGIIATLLVLIRLIDEPGANQVTDVKFGAYLGLLFAAGIAYGGWTAMRDEGTTLDDAAVQARGAVSGEGSATVPPAPPPPPPESPPPSGPPA